MAIHGKLGALFRKTKLKTVTQTIQSLSQKIQAMALKNGQILCRLSNEAGAIEFAIPAETVLQAAEAGVKYAEELKAKDKGPTVEESKAEVNQAMEVMIEHAGQTAPQPVGG